LRDNAEALFRGGEDLAQKLRVPHALEASHAVELAVPAPARIRIDLQQLDLAVGIGTEVEAGVVAAAEALEQSRRVLDELRLDVIRQVRFVIADLRPVRTVRLPFRLVAEDLRQAGVEPRVVDLKDG